MRIVTAVVLLLLSLPHSARGETVAVSLSGGKSLANWHGQADIQALTVEWLTFPRKRTAIGVWVGPQSIWQPRAGSDRPSATATNEFWPSLPAE